jgi:hypothetical protein
MPKSLSLNDWNLRGIDSNSEYFYYSQYNLLYGHDAPELSSWQVGNMTHSSYNYFGLDNSFNAKHLYYLYTTLYDSAPYDYMNAVTSIWDLTTKELYNYMTTMDCMV